MFIQISILTAFLVLYFLVHRSISLRKSRALTQLEAERTEAETRYRVMRDQRKILKEELAEKEKALSTLRANQDGIKTISASDLDTSTVDDNEKISRYLIQQGTIGLEQNEKVLAMMETMQMDYIGVCLTLGFLDLDTAQKTLKITKTSSKAIRK